MAHTNLVSRLPRVRTCSSPSIALLFSPMSAYSMALSYRASRSSLSRFNTCKRLCGGVGVRGRGGGEGECGRAGLAGSQARGLCEIRLSSCSPKTCYDGHKEQCPHRSVRQGEHAETVRHVSKRKGSCPSQHSWSQHRAGGKGEGGRGRGARLGEAVDCLSDLAVVSGQCGQALPQADVLGREVRGNHVKVQRLRGEGVGEQDYTTWYPAAAVGHNGSSKLTLLPQLGK